MSPALIQPITVPDLVEQVYARLLDAISEGTLLPGERLTQEDLAQRLSVSRQPVLQALRLLKKDGFVEDAPGRGVQVTQLDVAWIDQVYQVRACLDALAVRLAAERGAKIDPAILAQGLQAQAGQDVKAMVAADLAFHRAIYEASGNPLIAQSVDLHWHHLRRVMGAVLQSSQQRQSIGDEHEAIAQAIAQGQADLAVSLVQGHAHKASVQLTARLSAKLTVPHPHSNPTQNPQGAFS
jgi:DNA-binding GntR family transcriptional regulator